MARASQVCRLLEVLEQGPRPSESQALSAGNNTLTKPSGADGAVVFPDPNSTATFVLKGVAGDTGITQSGTVPFAVTCTGASFVVNVSGNTTAAVRWFRLQ